MQIKFVVHLGLVAFILGCETLNRSTLSVPSIPLNKQTLLSNPVSVNSPDSEFLWNQIVDTVDDYFSIKIEQRPVRDSTQWIEGTMETHPQIGATYLEPWRKDALEGYQRLQSTFQTIRRTAKIRVIPVNEGFSVAVEVIKEIEDVDRSLLSAEGSASIRHDGTLSRTDNRLLSAPLTLGWIRLENDTDLEQRILREIVGRVTNIRPPRTRAVDYTSWFLKGL
jgi:hypothetical protein